MSQLPAITVTVNQRQLAEVNYMLRRVPRAMPRVMSRSVNKVGTFARTRIVKAIAAEMPITQANLRNRHVKLRRATHRVWVATVFVSGFRIPLIQFKPRKLAKGLSWKTKKKGGRKRDPRMFIATMSSGHVGVFKRRSAGGSGDQLVPRLKIDERFGPSVPQAMGNIQELSERALGGEIAGRLEKEVSTQTKIVLDRRGRA